MPSAQQEPDFVALFAKYRPYIETVVKNALRASHVKHEAISASEIAQSVWLSIWENHRGELKPDDKDSARRLLIELAKKHANTANKHAERRKLARERASEQKRSILSVTPAENAVLQEGDQPGLEPIDLEHSIVSIVIARECAGALAAIGFPTDGAVIFDSRFGEMVPTLISKLEPDEQKVFAAMLFLAPDRNGGVGEERIARELSAEIPGIHARDVHRIRASIKRKAEQVALEYEHKMADADEDPVN